MRNRNWAEANADRAKAYKAEWYQANKARAAARVRERRDEINARRRERYAADPAKVLASQKQAREANPDINRQRCRAYRAANGDAVRAAQRERHHANAAANNAVSRAYYEANKKRLLQMMAVTGKRYRIARPEVHREAEARRRAQKRYTEVEKIDFVEVIRSAGGKCGICGEPLDLFGTEIDHIIPLARGGAHVRSNVQAAHASCNRAKGAKVA